MKPGKSFRRFTPLAGLIGRILPPRADRPAPPQAQRKLLAHWREDAPQLGAAAAHSHPLLFASGRLVVLTHSPAWATEIRHRAARLKSHLDAAGIRTTVIEVKTTPAPFVPTRRQTQRPWAGVPPDAAGRLNEIAAGISHDGLKQSLRNLASRTASGDRQDAD